jgi:hypothetical protein
MITYKKFNCRTHSVSLYVEDPPVLKDSFFLPKAFSKLKKILTDRANTQAGQVVKDLSNTKGNVHRLLSSTPISRCTRL